MSAEQLDLVDETWPYPTTLPGVRRSDPETSLEAANGMIEGAADHRAKILVALSDGIARTYVEIADVCGLEPIAVARRMSELARLGQVQRLQEKRPTPSGYQARLWRAS